jgi:hypothetical protein
MDPHTKNLIAEVQQVTGYPVSVEVTDGLADHARMVSARRSAPVHLIEVNSQYRAQTDYIVAVQCCMLLVTWSDPSEVWGISTQADKASHRVEKWSKVKPLKLVDPAKRADIAGLYLQGLLSQLFSLPLEIVVTARLFAEAESLRGSQAALQAAHLRRLSSILAPSFRSALPEEVFQANVGMNAAMAMAWSRLSGEKAPVIPYESIGACKLGGRLLELTEDLGIQRTSASHLQTVDAWAELLSLRSLYAWESSDRRS